ncbi:MAG: OmpH family outer membrane protein [Flavobacteriales bacterium]|nr:OmpH family outer membrane protein [Flavobacteriales bacterium]
MKTSWDKLSTIVLIIAVGVLYFLQFSEEKNTQEKTKSESQEYFQQPSNSTLKIAYVNSDTVSKHYLFAEKIQTALLAKRSSAENQIKGKYNSYQKMVTEYQNEAPIMGQREAAEKAQNIGLLEQEIMKLEKDLSDRLALEEIELTTEYIKATDVYMQKIGRKLGYDYVLSYRLGGPMLFADSVHEITSKIIIELNKEYNLSNK